MPRLPNVALDSILRMAPGSPSRPPVAPRQYTFPTGTNDAHVVRPTPVPIFPLPQRGISSQPGTPSRVHPPKISCPPGTPHAEHPHAHPPPNPPPFLSPIPPPFTHPTPNAPRPSPANPRTKSPASFFPAAELRIVLLRFSGDLSVMAFGPIARFQGLTPFYFLQFFLTRKSAKLLRPLLVERQWLPPYHQFPPTPGGVTRA